MPRVVLNLQIGTNDDLEIVTVEIHRTQTIRMTIVTNPAKDMCIVHETTDTFDRKK